MTKVNKEKDVLLTTINTLGYGERAQLKARARDQR